MHSGDGKSRVGRRVEDAGTGLASDILTAQPCDGSLQLVDWREKCRLARLIKWPSADGRI